MEKAVVRYLWDLNDNGVDHAVRWMKDEMGATGINLACAYHTGKFLLPDNPKRKVFWNGGHGMALLVTRSLFLSQLPAKGEAGRGGRGRIASSDEPGGRSGFKSGGASHRCPPIELQK